MRSRTPWITLSLLICTVAAAANAPAGGRSVGNGGKSVICRDPGGKVISAELLDFYEARVIRGIERDLGAPSLSPAEKIRIALKRLARLSPRRAEEYQTQANRFMDETLFLSGVTLVGTDDSDHIAFPAGCQVEQLAIQKEPRYPEDKRFNINQDLWAFLDNDSRAGLILHEIIYREAIVAGQEDSRASRYLNSYVTSRKIDTLSPETFTKLLEELGFRYAEFQGVWLSLFRIDPPQWPGGPKQRIPTPPEFHSNGNLRSAWAREKSTFTFRGMEFTLSDTGTGVDSPRTLPTLRFHENGFPAEIHLLFPAMIPWQGSLARIQYRTTFHPNGAFQSFKLPREPFRILLQGQPFYIEREAEWDEEGRLLQGYPAQDMGQQRLLVGDGRSEVTVDPSLALDKLLFHPNGIVQSCRIRSGTAWIGNQKILLDKNYNEKTEFHPDGTLAAGRAQAGTLLVDGKKVHLKQGSLIQIAGDGKIKISPPPSWISR